MSLFTREVTVVALSSGSSGNCTWIGDKHAGVLVDCGLSTKRILERIESTGLSDMPIDAVLITHEHSDHVGAAAVLARALKKRGKAVPFFMTRGTAGAINPTCVPEGIEFIGAGESFKLKHLQIEPIPVPHDTAEPCAYRVRVGDITAAVITDLGKQTNLVSRHLRDCDIAVLEFNHDEDMLMDGPYPWQLKQRIRGAHGHLSNTQAARLLAESLGEKLRHLVLAHLSEENNTPAKAMLAARGALKAAGAQDRVHVHIALQHAALAPVRMTASSW